MSENFSRRKFLQTAAVTTSAAVVLPGMTSASEKKEAAVALNIPPEIIRGARARQTSFARILPKLSR
jgi:hypothetical protein